MRWLACARRPSVALFRLATPADGHRDSGKTAPADWKQRPRGLLGTPQLAAHHGLRTCADGWAANAETERSAIRVGAVLSNHARLSTGCAQRGSGWLKRAGFAVAPDSESVVTVAVVASRARRHVPVAAEQGPANAMRAAVVERRVDPDRLE